MKLLVEEDESRALSDAIDTWRQHATCDLAAVEVTRAVERAGASTEVRAGIDRLFTGVNAIETTDVVLQRARDVPPRTLRSLDAIHLSTALSLGEELSAFATYDRRLAEAAAATGINVIAPGSA
ncbi:MAG: type II toxin-antitoxin system VapC family toxin [Thermoleophilaceae bacterium]|nr:type II toxin-antitoxin system VapC family toxin [Thermoleophilaceae bacterium]